MVHGVCQRTAPARYLLWITTSDLEACERLYMAKLTSLPGAARTNSKFTMKTVKKTAGLPPPETPPLPRLPGGPDSRDRATMGI